MKQRPGQGRALEAIAFGVPHIESDIHRVKAHGPITVSGAILHVLGAGNRFDMVERTLLPAETVMPQVRRR